MDSEDSLSDIKIWLKDALFKEGLSDFTVNILGGIEKGDGYMGDIVFVHVDGKTVDDESKSYDLMLKFSKKSESLNAPIKEAFENEIRLYDHVFPAFQQFQLEKGIANPFESVSPCFGRIVSENMNVLVLQNLKVLGYKLHQRRKPLDLDHLKLVVREYGKWHAISAAMQQQKPEVFMQLVDGIRDVWKQFGEIMDINKIFTASVDDMYNLIKDDVSQDVARKLHDFKNEIEDINTQLMYDRTRFCVITHGNGWNSNFMFKYEDETEPVKVAMLDWQISKFTSPVTDLSYFLFACSSRENLRNFKDLIREYHTSFSDYVRKLGSDPEEIFPYSKLIEDWKIFAKFGLMLASMVIKIALTEKDEVQDIVETLESGAKLTTTFLYEMKDKRKLKERFLGVVEHATDYGVI